MDIKGKFEVKLLNQKTFEVKTFKGENLITNVGKSYLSKWLMHSVLSGKTDEILNNSGEDSELLEVKNNTIVATNQNTGRDSDCRSKYSQNCLQDNDSYSFIYNSYYNFNSTNTYFRQESSIYFEFDTPKKIKKIIMKAVPTDANENNGSYYGSYLEVSTSSSNPKSTDWQIRKYAKVAKYHNLKQDNSYDYVYDTENASDLVIYLGDRNDPERAVENTKSIRITPYYYGMKIYNIAFFEEVDYPSPPCVIGLGTNSITPDVKDVDLGKRVSTLLAKCIYEEDENNNPKVIYRTKLGIKECNGNVFKEIGLFCVKDGVLPYKGQKLELFSHGLFETPWEKNSDIVADIKYILSPYENTGDEL